VLFIVASAAAIIGGASMVLPAREAETFADIAADRADVVSGVLIELLMVVAVIARVGLLVPVLSPGQAGGTGTKERFLWDADCSGRWRRLPAPRPRTTS
jgi:hypothetical protein